MATGTVNWFSEERRYGFVRPDGGWEDVFLHVSGLAVARIVSMTRLSSNRRSVGSAPSRECVALPPEDDGLVACAFGAAVVRSTGL